MANVGTGSVGKTLIGTGRGNSPTYVSLGTDSGLTQHGVVIAQGNNAFNATAAGTTGQVLTAVTNGDPVWSSHVAIDYHDSIYIVGANSSANYSDLATAYAAAVTAGAPATIMLQPGTYTLGSPLALTAGINITSHNSDASLDATGNAKIIGKLTYTGSGSVSISGVQLQTNSDYFLEVTGSNASVVNLINCFLNCSNNTGIHVTTANVNSSVNLGYCYGNIATTGISLFTDTSTGQLVISFSRLINTGVSTTNSTKSAGKITVRNSKLSFPITNSSTSYGLFSFSDFDCYTPSVTALTLNGTGQENEIMNCFIQSASGSAISVGSGATLDIANTCIHSNNASTIAGSGTIKYSNVTFDGTTSLISTTTQTPLVSTNDAMTVVTPGSYPYTTIPQDALILVDTSSASNTIVPLASPTIGQKHIIKDKSGNAGTAGRNITITPSGKNIDGAASKIININYGSVTIIYNGTEWSIT